MNKSKQLLIAAVAVVTVLGIAFAVPIPTKTDRTTALFIGTTEDDSGTLPTIKNTPFAGWNLVNVAMGRDAHDTNFPNQVLAMTFACDLSSVSLVVYDKTSSNVVLSIADGNQVDSVTGIRVTVNGTTNEVSRLVTRLHVQAVGNVTNGLAGGSLMVSARIHRDPVTGCPKPVLVSLDKDRLDRIVGDKEIPSKTEPDEKLVTRTGLGHLIGVLNVMSDGGTNTVLIPFGGLSIRREL